MMIVTSDPLAPKSPEGDFILENLNQLYAG